MHTGAKSWQEKEREEATMKEEAGDKSQSQQRRAEKERRGMHTCANCWQYKGEEVKRKAGARVQSQSRSTDKDACMPRINYPRVCTIYQVLPPPPRFFSPEPSIIASPRQANRVSSTTNHPTHEIPICQTAEDIHLQFHPSIHKGRCLAIYPGYSRCYHPTSIKFLCIFLHSSP